MDLRFDLAGRVAVSLVGASDTDLRRASAELDPFVGGATATAQELVLERGFDRRALRLVDVQGAARDGTRTASDGQRMMVEGGGRWCTYPPVEPDRRPHVRYEPGFPLATAFRSVVRPALQLMLPGCGSVAVHSAAVELDGGAVLIAGWSESGKTETALALMERGAHFLSDKWTVVGRDGEASAFPIGLGVRRWVLPHLPRLSAALPRAARVQLSMAAGAARTSRPLRRRRPAGRVGSLTLDVIERAIALADRAALSPTQIRDAYGQTDDPARRIPVRAVALLRNVDGGGASAAPVDPEWAARRLAVSAAVERRTFLGLQERGAFALGEPFEPAHANSIAADRDLLEQVFARTGVIGVDAPFPTDPGPVAEAVLGAL